MREAHAAMDALRRIVRAIRTAHSVATGRHDVSAAQLFVLKVIGTKPGQSLADVSQQTLTSQSSASEVVARLIQRGLISREVAANDHRRIQLTLTSPGENVVANAPETVQEKLVAGFLALPTDERRTLARGLESWITASGLEHVPATMFLEPV